MVQTISFNEIDNILFRYVYYIPLQFDAVENGMSTSKMMQVFSKQASMMDALITHFVEQMRRKKLGENGQPQENLAEGKLWYIFVLITLF